MTSTAVKRRACARDQFWLAARQFPAQISKNKHKKKPLSRKISERKLECSLKSTTTTTATINLIIQPRYRLRAQALVQNTNVPKRTRKKRFKYIIYNLNRLGEVVAVKKCTMRVAERFNSGYKLMTGRSFHRYSGFHAACAAIVRRLCMYVYTQMTITSYLLQSPYRIKILCTIHLCA